MQASSHLADRSLLNRLDFIWYDWRMWLGTVVSEPANAAPIVIADIDEASLAREGRWPWSRDKMSKLVARLGEAGASVIAFDIVYAEPEESTFLSWLRQQPVAPEAEATLEHLRNSWNPDRRLAETLEKYDAVLGFFFQNDPTLRTGMLPRAVASLPLAPDASQQTPSDSFKSAFKPAVVLSEPGFTGNIPVIAQGAPNGGFVTTYADPDGVIRRTPIIMAHEGRIYPSMALAAAMSFYLAEELEVHFAPVGDVQTVSSIRLNDPLIYTDGIGRVLVPYPGAASPIRYLPAWQILRDDSEDLGLDGAVVLVGGSSMGLFDRVNTPLATSFPGIEVQANVLRGLLTNQFPYRPAWEPGATFLQLLLAGLLLILVMPRRSPWSQAFWSLGTLAVLTMVNILLWIKVGLDLPLAATFLLILSLAAWFMFEGFVRENKSRKAVTSMFGQYVPAAHIDQMLSAPESYSMEGQNREMTVLFSDIRSFTTISETLSATELKALLNFYFTPITEIIFRHGGTIDKYVGDMVMAFWGAPLVDPDHRRNAVLAALEMIETTDRLRAELRARNLPEINIGIGLNTGFMNVGDMGSEYRKAYTVLGDAVNLGSRLESLTKFYGVDILVGPDTINNIEDISFRFVDRIMVKGKNEPIDAFEPLGPTALLDDRQRHALGDYNEALALYRSRQWDSAQQAFEKLSKDDPDCKIYHIYLERIGTLREQDLPPDWDGTYRHTSK